MYVVLCETNPKDARNGGSIENDDVDQSGIRQNPSKMRSMKNQENLQIDNKKSSPFELDYSLEKSDKNELRILVL